MIVPTSNLFFNNLKTRLESKQEFSNFNISCVVIKYGQNDILPVDRESRMNEFERLLNAYAFSKLYYCIS